MNKLRIIFMGTPAFSVPALQALASAHDVVAVYCQPAKPAGRGMNLQKCPVQLAAEELNIPVHTPTSFKKDPEAIEVMKGLNADFAVVAGYGKILPQSVLDVPKHGCLNIHPSLLPRWRGATPVQRTIEAGDAVTGVCIMQLEAGMDTGPLLAVRDDVPVPPKATSDKLYDTLFRMGADMLLPTIERVLAGAKAVPQRTDGVTHAAMIDKADAAIDWQEDAAVIERRLRAFTPWPGLFFMLNGARVKVLEVELADGNGVPGTLLDVKGTIACGNNTALRLLRVQREGKPPMDAADFLRGVKDIKKGDTLA